MPNTYTQLLFHVVFSTKNRERTLPDDHRELLYRYIWGIHKNLNCHMYRIGGIDDHVHILTATPTTLSLADYVKEVKTGSSRWLKEQADSVALKAGRTDTARSRRRLPERTRSSNISRVRPNITARNRCSMNIGDYSAKMAFRTTNVTWRELCSTYYVENP